MGLQISFIACQRTHGNWKLLDELDDLELRTLADKLPATILHSCADSSVMKYLQKWKTWASSKDLGPVPAKSHLFALYLQYLGENTSSKATVEKACNSASWVYASAGLSSLLADPFVKATLVDIQQSLVKQRSTRNQ